MCTRWTHFIGFKRKEKEDITTTVKRSVLAVLAVEICMADSTLTLHTPHSPASIFFLLVGRRL